MIPAPGSHAAVSKGCKCDMIRNQFGLGIGDPYGARQYELNPECKLHEHGSPYIEPVRDSLAAERRRAQQQRDRVLPNDVAGRSIPGTLGNRRTKGLATPNHPGLRRSTDNSSIDPQDT